MFVFMDISYLQSIGASPFHPLFFMDETMGYKLIYHTSPMMTNKFTPSVDSTYWLKSLDTSSLNQPIKIEFKMFLSQLIKKNGSLVIKLMVPV